MCVVEHLLLQTKDVTSWRLGQVRLTLSLMITLHCDFLVSAAGARRVRICSFFRHQLLLVFEVVLHSRVNEGACTLHSHRITIEKTLDVRSVDLHLAMKQLTVTCASSLFTLILKIYLFL